MSLFSSRARLLSGLLFACSVSAPPPADAAGLCLTVAAGGRERLSLPVAGGADLRLRFANSVYGSLVEEIFELTAEGFQSSRVLYAEPRLVEFYGYESAVRENGFWAVTPAPRRFNPLRVRASRDSAVRASLNGRAIPTGESTAAGSAVEFSIASCGPAEHE